MRRHSTDTNDAPRRAGIHLADLGTDVAGQPGDSDMRGSEGMGHGSTPFGSGDSR